MNCDFRVCHVKFLGTLYIRNLIWVTLQLTDEQRERAERNRRLALEKRLARQRQQQQYQESLNASQNNLGNTLNCCLIHCYFL